MVPHLYSYYASAGHELEVAGSACRADSVGVVAGQQDPEPGGAAVGGFTATASANIDSDAFCDGWYINATNRLENSSDDIQN